MTQRSLWEIRQLVAEIAVQHVEGALVARGFIVLLENLQGHHLGPPVVRLAPLQAFYVGMVGAVAEVALGRGGRNHRLHPALRLGYQRLVVQQVGQGQQAVDPVGTALPGVAFAAQPGVVVSYHFGIELVQMPGHTVGLGPELPEQPAFGLYRPDREAGVVAALKRLTVKHLGLQREGQQQEKGYDGVSFHILLNLYLMVQRAKGPKLL